MSEYHFKVSVIMATFNSDNYLESSVRSVVDQTYKNWELIVVDDSSSDSTWKILSDLAKTEGRMKIIRQEYNSGAANARNRGIEIATGRYIAFLDSDDLWGPEKLHRQLDFMERNDAPFSFTRYRLIDKTDLFLGYSQPVAQTLSYGQLLFSNLICCSTVIYDTNILGKISFPDIRKRQDYGLWLKLLKKTTYAYGLNEVLASYRVLSSSLSSNKLSLFKYNWQLFRQHENLTFWRSIFYLCANIYFRILKQFKRIFS